MVRGLRTNTLQIARDNQHPQPSLASFFIELIARILYLLPWRCKEDFSEHQEAMLRCRTFSTVYLGMRAEEAVMWTSN